MINTLNSCWSSFLEDEFTKPYFNNLNTFVTKAYSETTCYPKQDAIFTAFNACNIADVKVVILGQDPYHGPKQANGLAFSVADDVAIPPSLQNIFKELGADLGKPMPNSGNLERWATQGVLLLNATLTVSAGQAGSHQKQGWETFTDTVIKKLSEQKEGLIFLLWGGFAKKKKKLINVNKHVVLESGHPSPLSANRGYWFGNKHFSKTNAILKKKGKKEINW